MNKRFLKGIALIIVLLSLYSLWWLSLKPPQPQNTEIVEFTIPSNQSVRETINSLKNAGLIKSRVSFFILVRLKGIDNKIQAGKFKLKKSYDALTLANELTHGTQDIWLTILEGWRVEQTAEYLEKTLGINKEDYIRLAVEGYMFPDSYLVPQDSDVSLIVNLINSNYRQQVTPEILSRALKNGLNENQLITLASIVERETNNEEARRIVAGIMLKRHEADWPLQADATVQYAIGYDEVEKSWWKKNLTREDLNIDLPYNTYLYTGFPPSPIASPGLSSIQAIVNPLETDYWYYISDPQGNMHYAKSLEEHEENIKKYLQ